MNCQLSILYFEFWTHKLSSVQISYLSSKLPCWNCAISSVVEQGASIAQVPGSSPGSHIINQSKKRYLHGDNFPSSTSPVGDLFLWMFWSIPDLKFAKKNVFFQISSNLLGSFCCFSRYLLPEKSVFQTIKRPLSHDWISN